MAVDAGTIFSEVRIKLDKLKGDITNVEAQFNKFSKTNATMATQTQKKWTDSFKNINLQGVVAVAALTMAVKASISTFANFEQSLANVQSVARATPQEFEALEKAAIEAGETTRFTASQAADAMYSLASAGLDTKQTMEALDGVLQLAGATQSDLAFTADAVTATLSQYNLEASKAIDISNIYAAAIANSKATMDKLATSMRYVGPVASAFNMSVEETVGVLQILYDAGIEGSAAGTALRRVLADLGNSMGPVISKLERYGITFEDINPEVHSFAEIIETLKMHGVEGADALAIFGARAGPAMIKLLEGGREELEAYTEAVTDTNAAAEAYAIQNDTLAGSLDFLKSAAESAQISLVKEMSPAIRGIVDLLTALVKGFTSLPGPVKLFFGIVAVGIPVVAGLTFAISSLAAAIGASLGPITAIVAGIAGLITIVSAISSAMDSYTTTTRNLNQKTEELNDTNDELNEINKKLADSTDTLNEEERKTLENRKKLLKQNMAYNIATQAKAIADAQAESGKLNTELAKQKKLYDEINETGKATRDTWYEVYGAWGNYRDGTKEYLPQLSKSIDEINGKQANLNTTIEMGVEALAEGVLAENISLEQIQQINSGLAIKVGWLVSIMKVEKERVDLEAEIAEEEEKAAKDRVLADEEELKRLEELRKAWEENNKKRIEFEKEYSDKVFEETHNRLEILEKEKEEALAEADELGASRTDIERYYGLERVKIMQEEAKAKKTAIKEELKTAKEAHKKYIAMAKERRDKRRAIFQKMKSDYEDDLQAMLDATEEFGFSVGSVLSNLNSVLAENRIAELDRQLQAELQAAGVAEETTIERLNRELEAAKEAGDAELVAEKEKELKRAEITLEFERKKAQIRYDAEMAAWRISLLQATAEAARAIIIGALSAPFPFNLPAIGFASALGGLQIGTIAASEPVKPTFQTGGIVLGTPGIDNVDAKVTPGEMILTKEQQAKLFDLATGRETVEKNQYITIQFYQDDRRTAEKTVQYINGGVVRLKL